MDKILDSWLERQFADGIALEAASDVVALIPERSSGPPRRFVAQFSSPTLVREASQVTQADGFTVLFRFPDDYLRAATDAAQVVNLLTPRNVFHPNVRFPFICLGHMAPGTGLVDLIYQVWEILTFQKMTVREDDALNHDACAWARAHMSGLPLDAAPLRHRAVEFSIGEVQTSGDRP